MKQKPLEEPNYQSIRKHIKIAKIPTRMSSRDTIAKLIAAANSEGTHTMWDPSRKLAFPGSAHETQDDRKTTDNKLQHFSAITFYATHWLSIKTPKTPAENWLILLLKINKNQQQI